MKKRIIKITAFAMMFAMVLFGSIQSVKAWDGISTLKPYTPELVEMRAVWVATVANIDFAKQDGTSEAAIQDWKDRYIDVLDNAESKNLNTIIFQIRPNNDAFYPSKYNPWSEYLAGYGVDPGWDPLAWMLEVTHARGMEFHAWLNPYRTSTAALSFDYKEVVAGTSGEQIVDYDEAALDAYKDTFFGSLKNKAQANGATYDNPIFGDTMHYDVVLGAEDKFVLNPASERVLEHLNNTITEIVENYDIDGIHFDDYFYPNDTVYRGDVADLKGYTYSTEPYRDMADYKKYLANGGELSIYNWRRSNIDTLIKNLSDIIRDLNSKKEVKCAFGISPCARWAPNETCTAYGRGAEGGMSNNCNDYYAYSDLFADTRKWAVEEWIDYIVPQCYLNLDGGYGEIVAWWSKVLKNSSTKLYIGQGIYKTDDWLKKDNNAKVEMLYQVRYNQSNNFGVDGYFFYNYTSVIRGNSQAAMNVLSKGIWKRNTLTPTYDAYEYKSTVNGDIEVTNIIEKADGTLVVSFTEVEDAKAYMLKEYGTDVAELDFTDGKYVDLVFAGHDEIEFKPTEGKNYVLVPVAQDNTIQSNYTKVDLGMIVQNNIPTVEFESIPSTVLAGSNVEIKAHITDTDNSTFTYELLIAMDSDIFSKVKEGTIEGYDITYTWKSYPVAQENIRFKVVVNDGKDGAEAISNAIATVEEAEPSIWNIYYNLNGGAFDSSITPPSTYTEGVGLALLPTPTRNNYVFDGWTLNGEKVTSISTTQTGNVELVANWKEAPQPAPAQGGCGGCGKSSAQVMITTLSAISLAVLILRKK